MTEIIRTGPHIANQGNYDSIASLNSVRPATSTQPGTMAYCTDVGMVYSDGTAWRAVGLYGATGTQYLTSGASGTISSGVKTVILDGVNTTFALTFPVPLYDGQVIEVNAAQAVSVAFSAVATSPATGINTVPSTLAAGAGASWEYKLANTTWYRRY